MKAAALAVFFLAAPAAAQDQVSIGGTYVHAGSTEQPGAVAEVTMTNAMVNDDKDDGDYSLSFEGIAISVTFEWDASNTDDRMKVTVPEGFIAHPSYVDVPEYGKGTIYIYPADGVGM
jgi:hypothetical protein